MKRWLSVLLLAPAVIALAGCGPGDERPTAVTRPPAMAQAAPEIAPSRPPQPHAVLVPPPPQGAPEVWRPGHWRYTGEPAAPWAWDNGRYIPPPPGRTTWVAGHWAKQPGGDWQWIAGHWA